MICTRFARSESVPNASLLLGRSEEVITEIGIGGNSIAPALDSACRLETRHRGDRVAAREVVGRRKRSTALVIRGLFGDRRQAEWAAHHDAVKCPRGTTDLAFDDVSILHAHHRSLGVATIKEPIAAAPRPCLLHASRDPGRASSPAAREPRSRTPLLRSPS